MLRLRIFEHVCGEFNVLAFLGENIESWDATLPVGLLIIDKDKLGALDDKVCFGLFFRFLVGGGEDVLQELF